MKSMREAMNQAWATLSAGPAGEREWRALRIETGHTLDVFAAIREQDKTYAVLFECPISSAPAWRLRFESEGLRLFDERDARDSVRRIALALERSDLESVFQVIAEDLITSSGAVGEVDEAVAALGMRLSAWQTCLKLRKEGFGQERMLGLYGELVVLERLASVIGFDHAIAAWSGPERGLRDFVSNGVEIEVKTSLGERGAVQIRSLDQLDPSSLRTLALFRVVVVPDDAGTELSELIDRMRNAATRMGHSVRLDLDQRLLMSGYIDSDDGNLAFDRLTIVRLEAYDVHGDFPRLTREMVDAAVLSAEYRLDVTKATEYQMSAEAQAQLFARFRMGN